MLSIAACDGVTKKPLLRCKQTNTSVILSSFTSVTKKQNIACRSGYAQTAITTDDMT